MPELLLRRGTLASRGFVREFRAPRDRESADN